jgi:hypothetical protein
MSGRVAKRERRPGISVPNCDRLEARPGLGHGDRGPMWIYKPVVRYATADGATAPARLGLSRRGADARQARRR